MESFLGRGTHWLKKTRGDEQQAEEDMIHRFYRRPTEPPRQQHKQVHAALRWMQISLTVSVVAASSINWLRAKWAEPQDGVASGTIWRWDRGAAIQTSPKSFRVLDFHMLRVMCAVQTHYGSSSVEVFPAPRLPPTGNRLKWLHVIITQEDINYVL